MKQKYNKQYYQLHKPQIRLAQKLYAQRLRQKLINALGGKCVVCGFSDIRALQVDHINGGGLRERMPMGKDIGCVPIWRYAMKNLSKYQLLCANHNWIKKAENNEVPYTK